MYDGRHGGAGSSVREAGEPRDERFGFCGTGTRSRGELRGFRGEGRCSRGEFFVSAGELRDSRGVLSLLTAVRKYSHKYAKVLSLRCERRLTVVAQ